MVYRKGRVASPQISFAAAGASSIGGIHIHEVAVFIAHIPAGDIFIIVVYSGRSVSRRAAVFHSVFKTGRSISIVFEGKTFHLAEKCLFKE
ncbi:hypothetical protein BM221_010537 [Beauveria bassiana]|uniref:Uncharacterized protein n=1 Tax=Beauveria bassiana TaxID=176275 RepID=A0A2N6N8P9_BEABA|nr:hypothetical protein BM221_010537 [Beauveria bassiana]